MRARHPLLPVFSAVAALALLSSACGTASLASPTETAAVSASSVVAPTKIATSGPQVTVPGLGGTPASTPPSAAPSAKPSTKASAKPTPATTSLAPTTAPPVTTAEPTQTEPTQTELEPPAETSTPAAEPAPPKSTTPKPTAPKTTAPKVPGRMTAKTVVIDPGHNGANGANPDVINQQVDAGFGQTKPCNTTGTETNDGYTEATFTWQVALKMKAELESRGITVVMTRSSNDGVGPCVNERARIGNESGAAAVISIHGDGDDASANGYYVMTAERLPAGAEVGAESDRLASGIRDGLSEAGLSPNNHLGSNGLWKRGDLAGLNLSMIPTVMIELGNMRNAGDAELMSSAEGQQQFAEGMAAGVVQYLIGQ